MFQHIASWLEARQVPCVYREFLGFPCPGCGFQTSVIALLRGDFRLCVLSFPALFPLMLSVALLVISLVFNWNRGIKASTFGFVFSAAVMLVHWFCMLLTDFF